MGKKCIEEFNPWPPFVDIFSSTILVLLLFMLILIVNLGYYAQFKFKVTYSGTIATDQLLVEEKTKINKVDKIVKEVVQKETNVEKTSIVSEIVEKKFLERAGQDLAQEDDKTTTKQEVIQKDNYLVVNFDNKEILLDDITIKTVKDYIAKMKQNFPVHKVIISSVEPTNQVSSTIAKQIALARTLNTRNLIRKLEYKSSDVRIRLIDEKIRKQLPEKESGFVFITIKVNK